MRSRLGVVVLDLQYVELLVLRLVVWPVVFTVAKCVVSSPILISRLQVRISRILVSVAGGRLLVIEDTRLEGCCGAFAGDSQFAVVSGRPWDLHSTGINGIVV